MKPKRMVHGAGVNDADYVTKKFEEIGYVDGKRKRNLVWVCPYYRAWENMLTRCYSAKHQDSHPTYKGCSVSEEWLTFSAFKNWMMAQDWEGLQLDKDLLIEGNKVYGPDTCVFVTQTVNSFTIDRGNDRGKWLIGVDWDKRREKFRASCNNPFTKKKDHIGYFDSEQEAHNAWQAHKLELARLLADDQADPRVAKALVDRYSNQGATP